MEDGDDDKIVIFATDDNLKLLAEADSVFVDGTFHMCPEVFYQTFTVHAFKSGQQFPLAYCLLPGKSCESYQRPFTLLKEKADELQLDLSPSVVLSDFGARYYPSCRAEFSDRRNQGVLLPLLPVSKQKDSANWPSSCLSRRFGPKPLREENCSLGNCASAICTPGMASVEAGSFVASQGAGVRCLR